MSDWNDAIEAAAKLVDEEAGGTMEDAEEMRTWVSHRVSGKEPSEETEAMWGMVDSRVGRALSERDLAKRVRALKRET